MVLPIINVVIPALDPFGVQGKTLSITLDSLAPLFSAGLLGGVVVVSDSWSVLPATEQINDYCLQRLCEKLRVLFVVQKCPGHSCALNEGVCSFAEGHVLIMNPGDVLIASESVMKVLASIEPLELLFCPVVSDDCFIGELPPPTLRYPLQRLFSDYGSGCLLYAPHQGAIVPSIIHAKYRVLYDRRRQIRMDFCFFSRISRLPSDFVVTIAGSPLCYYPLGGKSGLKSNRYRFYLEALSVICESRLYSYAPRVIREIIAYSILNLPEIFANRFRALFRPPALGG